MEPTRLTLSALGRREAGEFAEDLDQSFSALDELDEQEDINITGLAAMLNQCHLKRRKSQTPANEKRYGPWTKSRSSNADLGGMALSSPPSDGQVPLHQSRRENTAAAGAPHLVIPPSQSTRSKNLQLLKDPVFKTVSPVTTRRPTVKALIDGKTWGSYVPPSVGEDSEVDMDDYDDFSHLCEGVWIPKYIPTPPPRSPETSDVDSEEEDVADLRKERIRTKY